MLAADEVLLAHDAFDFIGQGNERVTGRKSRGPQVARGSKLKVADVFFFPSDVFSFPSLHKIRRGFL